MQIIRLTALSLAIFTSASYAQTAPATWPAAPATRPALPATQVGTRPESRPAAAASAPAHVADYSTPRKAVAAFLTAPDEAAMREALIIPADHAADVNTLLGVMGATLRLEKAATAEFGGEGTKEFGINADKLQAALHTVEIAPVTLDSTGDSALVILPRDETARQSGGEFTVKKVGALWKIDALSLFQLNKPSPNLPKQLRDAAALQVVTERTITDIKDKKYNSAQDARIAYWNQSVAALAALQPGTRPATAPTIRP